MTCGYAVNEAVGNPAHAWITTVILWITKEISIAPLERLRRAGLRGRNTSTSETGTSPGETPGTRKEPGSRNRTRVAGPGGRPAGAGAARRTGQPGSAGRARPPPSHTWRGPCPIVPGWHALTRQRHASR